MTIVIGAIRMIIARLPALMTFGNYIIGYSFSYSRIKNEVLSDEF
jgi:hypothetical protein